MRERVASMLLWHVDPAQGTFRVSSCRNSASILGRNLDGSSIARNTEILGGANKSGTQRIAVEVPKYPHDDGRRDQCHDHRRGALAKPEPRRDYVTLITSLSCHSFGDCHDKDIGSRPQVGAVAAHTTAQS